MTYNYQYIVIGTATAFIQKHMNTCFPIFRIQDELNEVFNMKCNISRLAPTYIIRNSICEMSFDKSPYLINMPEDSSFPLYCILETHKKIETNNLFVAMHHSEVIQNFQPLHVEMNIPVHKAIENFYALSQQHGLINVQYIAEMALRGLNKGRSIKTNHYSEVVH